MKKLIVLALTMLMASSAFAVIDPDTNMIGFYFDTAADVDCTEAAPFAITPAYIILTNPDFEGLYGIEIAYTIEGNYTNTGTVWANPQVIDVGTPGNHIAGFGAPTPATEATLVMTLNLFLMDDNPVIFNMSGTTPSSDTETGLPVALIEGEVIRTLGFHTVDGGHCAVLNGACDVVATESMSFDSVKSLYR